VKRRCSQRREALKEFAQNGARAAPFALWQNSRKAERGAKQFLISCGCAAAFALY
jgi:hypothetical protein